MYVHVVGDARARGSAEIHAHVETRRVVNLTQRGLRSLGQIHHLIRDLFRDRVKLTRVQIRNDHQMPGDVRIEIEDDERVLSAVQHEIRFIVIGIVRHQAKDAAIRLRVSARGDVPGTPGTPQSIQFTYLDLVAA